MDVLEEHRRRQYEERLKAEAWEDEDLVFANTSGGPVYPKYALRRLQTLMKRAGLPKLTLYQLRHSGATLMLYMGVPLEQVQEALGHSTIAMTRQYAQVVDSMRRDTADRVGRAFDRASS